MSNLNIESLNRISQSGREITGPQGPGIGGGEAAPGIGEGGKSFSEILHDSVEKTNLQQSQADSAIKELVAGRSKNIHETMLAVERADSSLKLMMQVRNKIIDAYKEIMRMQI